MLTSTIFFTDQETFHFIQWGGRNGKYLVLAEAEDII